MRRLAPLVVIAALALSGCGARGGPSHDEVVDRFAETIADAQSARLGVEVESEDPDVVALAQTFADSATKCTDPDYWTDLAESADADTQYIWAMSCIELYGDEIPQPLMDDYASVAAAAVVSRTSD